MPVEIRKTEPECVRYIFSTARSCGAAGKTMTINKVAETVMSDGDYGKGIAMEMTQNAVTDGILVHVVEPLGGSSSRKSSQESGTVRLAKLEEIKAYTHDPYCFECHRPGFLECCAQCIRSFHRLCYRKNPDRPNYSVPSGKQQRNPLPAFGSSTDSESDGASMEMGDESEMRPATAHEIGDQTSVISSISTNVFDDPPSIGNTSSLDGGYQAAVETSATSATISDDKASLQPLGEVESKSNVDVVYLGEVRPPARKRQASDTPCLSYKMEMSQTEDENIDTQLCTCCRLLKTAVLRHPPNLSSGELCYLINFSFEHNRSWVKSDICEYLKTVKWSKKYVDLLTKILFTNQTLSLDSIKAKLDGKRYNYIIEFLVDLLDFQHNIGIFFGTKGIEFESTKWLVRDICHDLGEIRRCPDCFRHSHEKDCSIWFATPCLQRHELVFAKHSGFPYWPAKVMRVIGNNKYDVRFFGGDHSRALVDVQNIRPIDTEWNVLKLRSSKALRNAMKELHFHQILSSYPANLFAYGADKEDSARVIRSVLAEEQQLDRQQKSGVEILRQQVLKIPDTQIPGEQFEQNSVLLQHTPLETPPLKSKRLTRSHLRSTPNEIRELKRKLAESRKREQAFRRDNEKLQSKLSKLKQLLKNHEYEKTLIKRKQWCNWCLQEALFPCCFKASYCSEICQSRHWEQIHSKQCENGERVANCGTSSSSTL